MLGFITAQGEVSELKQSRWTLGHSLLVYTAIVFSLILSAASIWGLGLVIGGAIGIMVVSSLIVIYLVVPDELRWRRHQGQIEKMLRS